MIALYIILGLFGLELLSVLGVYFYLLWDAR
jgi:hypothetical protein